MTFNLHKMLREHFTKQKKLSIPPQVWLKQKIKVIENIEQIKILKLKKLDKILIDNYPAQCFEAKVKRFENRTEQIILAIIKKESRIVLFRKYISDIDLAEGKQNLNLIKTKKNVLKEITFDKNLKTHFYNDYALAKEFYWDNLENDTTVYTTTSLKNDFSGFEIMGDMGNFFPINDNQHDIH